MDKKNISPNPQQPVDRQPTGKLPNLLAELEEASLSSGTSVAPGNWYEALGHGSSGFLCSYDGEDE